MVPICGFEVVNFARRIDYRFVNMGCRMPPTVP
jgi:hypothetical protein